jgi:glyceraldehyde 3-phosphate dehydrogenase
MTVRVAINGFGRMGRLGLRAAWGVDPRDPGSLDNPTGPWGAGDYDIVHVNEIDGDAETAAHLLAFDSVHGRWPVSTTHDEHKIGIGARSVSYSDNADLADTDWGGRGIDLVVEATGRFKTAEDLRPCFDAGVKKVVVACPVKDGGALNIVMGVNDHLYEHGAHHLVTAASCTTNCLAPVVKVLHEGIGIRHGAITTIHDVTNTQVVVDKPHKDLRRARSSLMNLIPTSTGSATAIGLIFPELQGKLNGAAVRVPLLNASLTDCVFEMGRATTVDEVNGLFKVAAEGNLRDILGFEDRPLVSTDFTGDPRSGILDAASTMVVNGSQVKVLVWYDNEWGYVNRMMELVAKVAASMR